MNSRIDTDKWVDRYGDTMYAYALKRVSDPIVAQDLVQDTFVAALGSYDSFSAKSSEKTWLIGILKHKILDYYRSKHRGIHKALETTSDIDSFFNEAGHWKEMPSQWNTNPEQVLKNKEFLAVLHACIDMLTQNQKNVFIFREIDGVALQELCKIFSLSSTNLSVILYRARNKLRECIDRNWFNSK